MKDSETEGNNVCRLFHICCLGLDLQGFRLTILLKGSDSTVPFKNTSKDDDEGYQREKDFFQGCVNLF